MPLRVTLSSASYDDDETFVVDDTPAVRRALELRQQIIDATGDGSQDVVSILAGSDVVRTSEEGFIDFILLDISDGSDKRDDENRAYIYYDRPPAPKKRRGGSPVGRNSKGVRRTVDL